MDFYEHILMSTIQFTQAETDYTYIVYIWAIFSHRGMNELIYMLRDAELSWVGKERIRK